VELDTIMEPGMPDEQAGSTLGLNSFCIVTCRRFTNNAAVMQLLPYWSLKLSSTHQLMLQQHLIF
jgi:hypothetical protein